MPDEDPVTGDSNTDQQIATAQEKEEKAKKEWHMKRRNAKSLTTRKVNSLKLLVEANRPREEVSERVSELKFAFASVLNCHEQYCNHLDDDAFEEEEDYMERIEENKDHALIVANDYLRKLTELVQPSNSSETTLDESDQPNLAPKLPGTQQLSQHSSSVDVVSKPEPQQSNGTGRHLTLRQDSAPFPSFDGSDRLAYFDFRDDFAYAIGTKYSKQDAKYILDQQVKGTAKEWIEGERDYDEAWATLNKIYGDSRLVSDELAKKIKAYPQVHENEYTKFKGLFHLLKRANSILKRLQRAQDLDNSTMLALIESKLSVGDRLKWAETQQLQNKDANINNLLEWLSSQLWIRQVAGADSETSRSAKVNLTTTDDTRAGSLGSSEQGELNATSTGIVTTPTPYYSTAGGKNFPKCWHCQKNAHTIDDCETFRNLDPQARLDVVRKSKACYSCLKIHRGYCFRRKSCPESDCNFFHHRMLHGADFLKVGNVCLESNCVLLPIVTSVCRCPSVKSSTANALVMIDSGSQLTIIREGLAEELKLTGRPITLKMSVVGGQCGMVDSKLYEFDIQIADGNWVKIKAVSMNQISDSGPSISESMVRERFGDIGHWERGHGPVDLLIGIDNPRFHTGNSITSGNLALKFSDLGPVVFGFEGNDEPEPVVNCMMNLVVATNTIDLSQFFECEDFGVAFPVPSDSNRESTEPRTKILSPVEMKEYKVIRASAEKVGNQWRIPYPWDRNPEELLDNAQQAHSRFRADQRRFERNPEAGRVKDGLIEDLVKRQCARKLTPDEINRYSGPVHYCNSHVVHNPNSLTTPHRLVFNPAEQFKGQALNDFFMKGPDLLPQIISVLIPFRDYEVAYLGDFFKCFNQVQVSELCGHVMRFLHRSQVSGNQPDTYILTALTFGAKPAPAMANTAIELTAEENRGEYPEAYEVLHNHRYMDDVADSRASVEKVRKLCSEIDTVLDSGHFVVKKWTSNQCLNPADMDTSALHLPSNDSEKVLGLVWYKGTDELGLKITPPKRFSTDSEGEWMVPEKLTKRLILSVIAGIFDVFGQALPKLNTGKVGLQTLFRAQFDWDELLPDQLSQWWADWIRDLALLKDVRFPRCMRPPQTEGKPILCIFADASEKCFGAVAYCRWRLVDGSYVCRFIIAKGRVAPLKSPLTIPKLELNGLVVASRLKKLITSTSRHEFEKTVLFSDSKIAIAWANHQPRDFKTFVSHRAAEIQANIGPDCEIQHVRSEENPADVLTRGMSSLELNSDFWGKGPAFLRQPEPEWNVPHDQTSLLDSEKEIVSGERKKLSPFAVNVAQESGIIWDRLQHISSKMRAVRAAAYVLRASAAFRGGRGREVMAAQLTPGEVEKAEMVIIQRCQLGLKVDDYKTLSPFVDSAGTIRVGGRVGDAPLSYDTKHPVLLPPCWFSRLIVHHCHNVGHNGVATTVAKTRRKYWILGATRIAKTIKFRCVTCRELDKRVETQLMADLPEDRLRMSTPAFYVSAVDLFGPIKIKFGRNKTDKTWGVLFTCLNCRAVYLDLAQNYSTDAFLMTFRRFISIRGCPSVMYSDRGGNLKGADKEIKEAHGNFDYEKIQDFCSVRSMEWKFVTPKAAHHNGAAESLIKTTKRTLARALGNRLLYPLELLTVFFEVAQIINQRPIGRVSSDPNDTASYLCPNDLLLGRASSEVPQGPFKDSVNMKQRFELCQEVVNHWWGKWYKDVFPILVPRKKWHVQTRNVSVGDFVLVRDPSPLRSVWTKGLVSEVFPGRDGRIRNVKVKSGSSAYERPVTHIVVLRPVEGYSDFEKL